MYKSGILLSFFEILSIAISASFSIPFGFWLSGKNLKKFWVLCSIILGIFGLMVFLWLNIYTLLFYNVVCIFAFIGIGIANQTLLVETVDKDELPWANNVIFMTLIAGGVVIPLVGGYVLTVSWRLPFLIDSLTFFVESVLISSIPFKQPVKSVSRKKEKLRKQFKLTVQYLRKNRILKYTFILCVLLMLTGGGVKILNIAYFSQMPSPYILYGFASAISSIGTGCIMIFVTFKVLSIKNPYRALVLSLPFYATFYIGMYLLYHNPYTLILFSFLGLGNGLSSPNINATIQRYTERKYLPQVIGIKNTIIEASQMISMILMGVLIDIFSPLYIYLFSGLLISALFLFFYPTVVGDGRLESQTNANN